MRRNILALCAAAAMSGCAGGPTIDERAAAHEAEYKQTMAKIRERYEADMAKIQADGRICMDFLKGRKIGSSELELKQASCDPDKINTTKTGSTTFDQWVYDFVEDGVMYLYYTNGRLTAIQY